MALIFTEYEKGLYSDGKRSGLQTRHLPEDAEILPYVEPEPDPYDEIATLERTRTERRKREARMGVDGAQQWLDDLDVEIEALRP